MTRMEGESQQVGAVIPRRATVGMVRSLSGAKTVTVIIENRVRHPQYGKTLSRRTRLSVHDERGQAHPGDVVEIAPCRRISRTKSWRLVRVVRPASLAPELPAT